MEEAPATAIEALAQGRTQVQDRACRVGERYLGSGRPERLRRLLGGRVVAFANELDEVAQVVALAEIVG
jgi:hypothetical protein